ncbi:MAG TPA: ABC transporter ATP-binding protein [Candidatus Polarisedimenticolia bacterium]|nr:ABC transporter ATP-binding protein [Candidatus Polarisedimenticolia bacterium]
MSSAVQTDSLSKVYIKRRSLREMALHPFASAERVTALHDVSLQVQRGEIFGLLGPNGAGKTTLLKILACLVLPSSGQALVDGANVGEADRRVKQSIGFVTSDERSFYWRLTGRENLEFFGRLYGLGKVDGHRRTRELIGDMELGEVADRQFMSYSSGMKQRMSIARALLHDPPILCLDEPTRSLDPIAAKHLRSFVSRRLHGEAGKTILLATHNLQEAEEMCARLAVLERGRVLRQGTIAEVTSGLPGRDVYLLVTRGLDAIPRDARWSAQVERREAGAIRFEVSIDRGGEALSDLLRTILAGGASIAACTRREPSLQDVFDLMESTGGSGGAA